MENLQNKSESTKRAIMWTGTFLIMIMIFSFWLLTFSWQVSQIAEDSSASELKKELPSVFNSLKSQVDLLFEVVNNLSK